MPNVAFITGTGTVTIEGVVSGIAGSLKGVIKDSPTRLYSITLMANTGSGTAFVYHAANATATGPAGTYTVATGSSRTVDYGGAAFPLGLRIPISGTMHGVIAIYD